jgi:predicted nucleotidyltransferase
MNKKTASLTEVLKNHSSVVFAYLFGSKAKGYANPRSDWDIAVYLAGPLKTVATWPAFELEAEVSRVLEETVQVVILNDPVPPVLGFEIVKHGILLLDRNQNLRMEFENKVLRNYYDWQYFLKRQIESEIQ